MLLETTSDLTAVDAAAPGALPRLVLLLLLLLGKLSCSSEVRCGGHSRSACSSCASAAS